MSFCFLSLFIIIIIHYYYYYLLLLLFIVIYYYYLAPAIILPYIVFFFGSSRLSFVYVNKSYIGLSEAIDFVTAAMSKHGFRI